MTSIYQQAMGAEFENLHPMIQKRFGFSADDGIASIGRGVMEKVWLGRSYTIPFLYVGSWRNSMFPEAGENVPFTIENYAYRDSVGRETVTWIRTFDFRDRRRRFDVGTPVRLLGLVRRGVPRRAAGRRAAGAEARARGTARVNGDLNCINAERCQAPFCR
jgi:hypothetical protein